MNRNELMGYISDVYRELNGIRPHWIINYSMEELESMADDLDYQMRWQCSKEEANSQMECFALHHPRGIVTEDWDGKSGIIQPEFTNPKLGEIFSL
jgi:hypothetical protein